MNKCEILDLKETFLENKDEDAELLRNELKKQGVFYMNVMSSPGSGKTTTILGTLNALKDSFSCGVMEADIDSSVDAEKVLSAGFPSVQLHTGGMCHLDADMSRQGMRCLAGTLDGCNPEVVILENVGNLVCPAEFDTGASMNVVILSVPEGNDKPLKYPLMFEKCSVVLVNKIDTLPVFDFDRVAFEKAVKSRNPEARIFYISALTGEGMDDWTDYLKKTVSEYLAE